MKGYADKSKVEKDRNSGTLPQDIAEALLGIHGRSGVPLADRPSDTDIQLLKDLYGSCIILNLSMHINNVLIISVRQHKLHHPGTTSSARKFTRAQEVSCGSYRE